MLNSQRGFSLIELMIVVAIIGVLAAIAVPNFQKFQLKAKQSEAKGSLSAIYAAEIPYQGEYGTFAGRLDAIGWFPAGPANYSVGWSSDPGAPSGSGPKGSPDCYSSCLGAGKPTAGNCQGTQVGDWTCSSLTRPIGTTVVKTRLTPTTFVIRADAIFPQADDTWAIDDQKQLWNPRPGF